MELAKLKELVAFLREAGVTHYADDKVTLQLSVDEYEDEVEMPSAPTRQEAPMDPREARFRSMLTPDYQKAFDIRVGKKL